MNDPQETLDLMRDEFARIAADPAATNHIKWLCQRAMMEITCRTPLIVQRDRAERELGLARTSILDALSHMENSLDVIGRPLKYSDAAKRLQKALPSYYQPHGTPDVKESLNTETAQADALDVVTEQRDRLAAVLQRIRDGYGGQAAAPDCCEDCEFLIPIDEALQSLNQPTEMTDER